MTQAGGKGGLEPPFHCPSSTWLREIEREIPPEFGRPRLARLRRLTAVLAAVAMDRSACGGPVDQGFADAGMDDDNPALWNIRHDITPMFGRITGGYPHRRFRAVIRITYRGIGSFAASDSPDDPPARSPQPRPRGVFKVVMPLLPLTKSIMTHHILYVQQ